MSWIAGLTGTALAGKYVWDADLGSTYEYKSAYTANAEPQGVGTLVSPQLYPAVDFSAYPAQNACKAMGGRLPNTAELAALAVGAASYGNNFQSASYWSSVEYSASQAYAYIFPADESSVSSKRTSNYVRPVLDTLPVVAPTVTDSAPTSVAATTATGNGNVTSDGGGTISARGVVWGTSASPTLANSHAEASGTTGAFTASMTSLSASTLYYWRMYATNSVGTTYSTGGSFTTNALFIPRIICC